MIRRAWSYFWCCMHPWPLILMTAATTLWGGLGAYMSVESDVPTGSYWAIVFAVMAPIFAVLWVNLWWREFSVAAYHRGWKVGAQAGTEAAVVFQEWSALSTQRLAVSDQQRAS